MLQNIVSFKYLICNTHTQNLILHVSLDMFSLQCLDEVAKVVQILYFCNL